MPSSPRRPLPFTVTQKDEEKKCECLMSALGQKQTCAVQNVMSALPPIADMCGAKERCPLSANSGHLFFFAVDIAAYSRIVSARVTNDFGNVIPSAFATFRLTANSNPVGRSIGKSVGRAPLRILSMYPAMRRISSLVLGP